MSFKIDLARPVPETTANIAHAAFPKGNPYLTLRDQLGMLFDDDDFADLFPDRGQPGLCPRRLALVTVLQFRENLSDRQAADAVRARIDWKYLLGLKLSDPGFDFSVLCEFRARLIAGKAEDRLLERLLVRCRDRGLLKARGRQRTDSTHVLAAIRELNRLELLGETMRAALNELAAVEPAWLQGVAPKAWYERYGRRVEDSRLPRTEAKRQAYAQTVGEDGFALLAFLDAEETPSELKQLPKVQALRTAWSRHFEYDTMSTGSPPSVRFKSNREVAKAEEKIESPYDIDARYRNKRSTQWTGYMVHQSKTCDDDSVHLVTHVHTTPADVHEAMCTATIHQAMDRKGLLPKEHLADAAYISADLLVQSQDNHGIELIGPPRPNPTWQNKVEGAYTVDQFAIDWQNRVICCPKGVTSTGWHDTINDEGKRRHKIHYARRAGIEGTLSQAVRAFGARRSRYAGLAKTHLQQVATAAAMNLDRLAAWFAGRPQATTRTSRFAALAA